MHAISKSILSLMVLSTVARAQVPSTNDTSDLFDNTGMGSNALVSVTPSSGGNGSDNTAAGFSALFSNTVGYSNTAFGSKALYSNVNGDDNTASGFSALYNNVIGFGNTATGFQALFENTGGSGNTADGLVALKNNTTGTENTALGDDTLVSNTTGGFNTATGAAALALNKTGSNNTADGSEALEKNRGSSNTAVGFRALFANTTGANNTASGLAALKFNTTGENNIAFGAQAGSTLTTGSDNIEIGNVGTAADNNVIRIGTENTQAKTYIAGIYNVSVTGNAVMINSDGQLGVVVSSERFKTDVEPMATSTAKLNRLRPVTFRLKTDPRGTLQYGLIAEDVAKIYPELAIRDSNGRIDGVRYDELAPLLLNEVQQQSAEIKSLQGFIKELQAGLREIKAQNQALLRR